MNDDSISPDGDKDPETGLATTEILSEWLGKESMSLEDAAQIAHGANPAQQCSGLHADRVKAVFDTTDFLERSIKLEVAKTVGGDELYAPRDIFQALAARKGHKFPTLVRKILLEKHLIRPGKQVRSQRSGYVERYEGPRIQVMQAMICVLANPEFRPSCRKDDTVDGPVSGAALARTIMANQKDLFVDGKSPQLPDTIAKLFNDIVRPQAN